MATIALISLLLAAFDLSYIPQRSFYLRQVPEFTRWYGERFKGIEPHRATETYLNTVDQLKNQVAQTGLRSSEVEQLLSRLRVLSDEMIDENPFDEAGLTGTLERIKNRVRIVTEQESSHRAFNTFWSQAYLSQVGWFEAITFFDRRIRPLMATNYYRSSGENGAFTDLFWQIDLWFIGLFGIEFLVRTFYLNRRYSGVTWFDAMLWRWYDVFLLLPFWRWLRVIPVTVRLHQSWLLNLEPIRTRITHGIVTSFAVELTETVILRLISELQDLVQEGKLTRWLLRPQRQYIDLNNQSEVAMIAGRLTSVLVSQVMPKIRPDVEALVNHSLDRVLRQNPVYARLQQLPGIGNLPAQLTEQLVAEVYQTIYNSLTAVVNDPETEKLTHTLLQKFGETFKAEVRHEKTLKELETLVTTLLEEIKINYVDRISELDSEGLRQQNYQLYEIVQGNRRLKGS